MTQRLTLTIVALTGFGFLGVPQSGYSETQVLTLGSDPSPTGDSPFQPSQAPPEANDVVASAVNSSALIGGSNAEPGGVNQVNPTNPGNAALDASRVASPPQSRLKNFFSAFIQFGAAAASANR